MSHKHKMAKLINYNQLFLFQLVFEAVRGKNFRGDISLDDIVYSIGRCPIQPIEADPKYVTTVAPTTPTTTLCKLLLIRFSF